MNINDHIRDNPFAIVRGYVPLAGIIDNLKNKYHAVDMPTDDIPNLWMHRFNAVNLPSNETRRLTESQLQIKDRLLRRRSITPKKTIAPSIPVMVRKQIICIWRMKNS